MTSKPCGIHQAGLVFFVVLSSLSLSLSEKWSQNAILKRHIIPEKDPQGNVDTYSLLSEKEKKILSHSTQVGVKSKLQFLQNLETYVSVNIRLVGFEGDGNLGLKIKEVSIEQFTQGLDKKLTFFSIINFRQS